MPMLQQLLLLLLLVVLFASMHSWPRKLSQGVRSNHVQPSTFHYLLYSASLYNNGSNKYKEHASGHKQGTGFLLDVCSERQTQCEHVRLQA